MARYMGLFALAGLALPIVFLPIPATAPLSAQSQPKEEKVEKPKGDAEKIDRIIRILEEMRTDYKAARSDLDSLKRRVDSIEEALKNPVTAKGTESAKVVRPPAVREFHTFAAGKMQVEESFEVGIEVAVAQGKEQAPVPAPAKNTVVEIKNTWTNEVTLLLNDQKHKVPAQETKSFNVEPGEFTYQIEGITAKIKRTIKAGENYRIVVRSTEDKTPAPNEKPVEPEPKPVEPEPKPVQKTGTLVLKSTIGHDTTIVVNGKRYTVKAGQTVRVEVPAGTVRSHVLGSPEVILTECTPGGNYVIAIQPDTRNVSPPPVYSQPAFYPASYYYSSPGYYYPMPAYYSGQGGFGRCGGGRRGRR